MKHAFADPMIVPIALVFGVLLGSALTWPIAYLRGRLSVFVESTEDTRKRLDRYRGLIRTAPADMAG